MFIEHQIAQAEYQVRNAKYNQNEIEGMTVRVPNAFDRVVRAVRSALANRNGQHKSLSTLTRSSAVLK